MSERHHYCKTCFRTLPADRDACADCARRADAGIVSRIATVLLVVAAVALIGGILAFDRRLCAAGAVMAVIGLVTRLSAL